MREKSRRHKQLEVLSYRYDLVEEELGELENLRRGYEGELEFDKVFSDEFIDVEFIHIKDYCFRIDRKNFSPTKSEGSIDREVQIDNIIIAGDRILTFEIKNYNFDLNYGDGQWTYMNGKKFSDPLMQIRRQKYYFQELIEELGSNLKVFSTLVFINPDQTIYNLPEHPEIIIRSNLLKKLKKVVWKNRGDYSALVEQLEVRRLSESQYQRETGVLFEELKLGVFCGKCGGRLIRVNHINFPCSKCKATSTKLSAIKRLIYEMETLNSSWKISPSNISQFSDKDISEGCVRRHKKEGSISF